MPHKNYYKFIILILLLMVGIAGAVPVEEWNKTYGGWSNDEVHSVQQTTDGGYILAGGTSSYGYGGTWLIKTDANGIEEWNKTLDYWTGYGDVPDSNNVKSVRQTSDGGFVMTGTGSTAAGSSTQEYGFIIKTDGNGNIQCLNKLGSQTTPTSIQQTTDGGYIITGGISFPWLWRWNNLLLLKVNSGCGEEWKQAWDYGMDQGMGYSVQQTSDGGYIIAGKIATQFDINALLIKTDANGNQQWSKIYGGAKYDWIISAEETTDGGYILGGETYSYSDNPKAWLLKTDANGIEQWNKTHGGAYDEEGYTAQQTSDGGYALAGITRSSDGQKRRASLIKTDANGNKLWNMSFGGTSDDYAYSFQQTSDEGYVLAGRTLSYGIANELGHSNAWLIKVSADDTTPPANVLNLQNISYSQTYINWTWTDPADTDFANVSVWIDGIFKENVPKGIQFYNATGLNPDTEHTIGTRTLDTKGNINQTWKNHTARTAPLPDLTAPTTNIELSGTLGNNNWYVSNVQVTLTASDEGGSGIAKTEYSLNGGVNWIQYSNPFSVSNEGTTTILYKSTDNAGNVESTKTKEIKIDRTAIGITISSPEAKDYVQTGSLALNFEALDTISGIDSITSTLDSMTVINGAVIDLCTLTLGQHTLLVNAIDKAGNTASNTVTFNLIEIVPPIPEQISEFPIIAMPIVAIIGLLFLFQKRKGK